MTANRLTSSIAAMAVTLAAWNCSQATAVLVDDFDTPGLSEYTLYKVLDQGDGTTNISFSDAGGTIDVTSTGSSGAEQVLFLRGDGPLEQGEELQINAPTAFNDRDFGLAIGETPNGLADGVAGDNRNMGDFLFMAWRNLGQLNSRGFDGGSEIGQVQNFGTNAEKLFIARLDNDDAELGWYDGATRNVTRTVTPATLDIYSNIGFYADIRADGNGFIGADTLNRVPEPSTLFLAAGAMVGLLAVRRRK